MMTSPRIGISGAAALVAKIKGTVTKTSFDSFVNSELLVTLAKMAKVSKLIGLRRGYTLNLELGTEPAVYYLPDY